MGNLYGKDASDPEWPSGGSTRATKVTYSVTESQQLKVEGSASKGEYELHQDKETIIGIVELMNEITEERQKKAVGEYKEGLLRYLTAIMRRVADFSKRKKPNLIEKTLRDYMDREVNGFTHDPAGRLAWKDWKQSVAEEEAPVNANNLETYRSQSASRASSPMSQFDMQSLHGETDGSEVEDGLVSVPDVIEHAGPGPHRSPKKMAMQDKLKGLQLGRQTPSRSPSASHMLFPKPKSPLVSSAGLTTASSVSSLSATEPQPAPASMLGLQLVPPELRAPSTDIPGPKDVQPRATLSVLRVGPDGRILASQAESASQPSPSVEKQQLHHVLWDVLNENKLRSKGRGVMSDAQVLEHTKKAIRMYGVMKDKATLFGKVCTAIGKAGSKLYSDVEGMSRSEKQTWHEMQGIHQGTFSSEM